MVDLLDLSYLAAVGLAGAVARSLRRGLPEGIALRLGAEGPDAAGPWVWVQAVSVGELLLAEGLVGRMLDRGLRVHLTTGTPAGVALLRERLPRWDAGRRLLSGGAFPVDDPAGLEAFLGRPPAAFVALETELWPNLLRELEARGIPRCIVNGRLTAKSLRNPWARRAIGRLSLVAARDEEALASFRACGAPEARLGGNLKADLPLPPPLHGGWAALEAGWRGAPIVVAGSTLEGEEALVVEAWRAARAERPDLRLILAPRQPRRFGAVAAWLEGRGEAFRRASAGWAGDWSGTHLLLLDTLGELPRAYGLGAAALVGGGWTGEGGHNPLEPARFGVPTAIGPCFANFRDLVEPLRRGGAVEVVPAEGLAGFLGEKLHDGPRPADAEAMPFSEAFPSLSGALDRTWSLLEPYLPAR